MADKARSFLARAFPAAYPETIERAVRDPKWGAWGRGADIGDPLGGNTKSGVEVTVDTATAFTIAYSCITIRGETLQAMPVDQVTTQGGVSREVAVRARWLDQPNVDMLWPTFIDQLSWSLDTDGNLFIAVTRDPLGRVVELWPVDPCSVQVRRDRPGAPRQYLIDGVPYRGELLHAALHIPPGVVRGISPIMRNKEAIGGAIAAQTFGSTWFGNSAMPSIVINHPGQPTVDQQREMRSSWFRHHGGPARANLPGLLTGGATATVLSLSPEQSQFLETRRFSAVELCNIWKVPPQMLGFEMDSLTYQNMDKVKLRLYQQGLLAPMALIEGLLSSLLPRPQKIKLNPDVWLRADLTSRYAAHQVGISAGFLTVNEARALENLPPIDTPAPEPPAPAPDPAAAGGTPND